MQLGERRLLTLAVTIDGSDNFELREADYCLTLDGEEVDRGTPMISGHEMTLYLEPTTAGRYRLKVKFGVGSERIVRSAYIDVEK